MILNYFRFEVKDKINQKIQADEKEHGIERKKRGGRGGEGVCERDRERRWQE